MPDDLSKRGGQDRKRIDVSQEHELRSWSEKFSVSREQLKEAVQAVGDSADDVQRYLGRGGDRGGKAGGSGSERGGSGRGQR
jgi:hypothetical protein